MRVLSSCGLIGLPVVSLQEKIKSQAQLPEVIASLSDRCFSKRHGMDEQENPHHRVYAEALGCRAIESPGEVFVSKIFKTSRTWGRSP